METAKKEKGPVKKVAETKQKKARKKKIIVPKVKKNIPEIKQGIIKTHEARTKKKKVLHGRKLRRKQQTLQSIDLYNVILFPLSTEKGVRLMESENKLLFVVDKRANKQDIKKAIELIFKVKVEAVNIINTSKGQKRAYVKFSFETPAIDIATDLGMI